MNGNMYSKVVEKLYEWKVSKFRLNMCRRVEVNIF